MRPLCFVFCHGFGFDANYWQSLRVHCYPHRVFCLDLGYFGPENKVELSNLMDNTCVIGVGHSLGFMKLLQANLRLDYLIGLNAFRNFLGSNEHLAARRTRELAQLSTYFRRSPQQALHVFYQRTGVPALMPDLHTMHLMRLSSDLRALSIPAGELPEIPQLILASADDTIVPPELVWDNFASCPQVTVDILSSGQHALGYWESSLVMQRIIRFIDAN